MKRHRRPKVVASIALSLALATTFAVAAFAGRVCDGGSSWTQAGCEGHSGYVRQFQSCVFSPGSSCAICWYNCEDGGYSKCAETDDGSVKNCFNLRYDSALPDDWWQY